MKRRWYKRCGADFIHGTMKLTLEEKGAYSLCLDLIYDRGGPIPDDERWLAGICNISTRKWRILRDRLVELGKLSLVDGHLSNTRAEFEIVSAETHARKLSESGAKGGRTRAENEAASKENNNLEQAGLKHLREEKRREDTLAKANGASADSDAEFWSNAKAFLQSESRNPGALLGKWRRDHGLEATAQALTRAQLERPVQRIPFIEGCLRATKTGASGYEWIS